MVTEFSFSDISIASMELESLHDSGDLSLNLTKTDDNLKFRIIFNYPIVYRVMDESHALAPRKTMWEEERRFGALSIYKESELLSWFKVESDGILDSQNLRHYRLLTANDIVDVISSSHPVIESTD